MIVSHHLHVLVKLSTVFFFDAFNFKDVDHYGVITFCGEWADKLGGLTLLSEEVV